MPDLRRRLDRTSLHGPSGCGEGCERVDHLPTRRRIRARQTAGAQCQRHRGGTDPHAGLQRGKARVRMLGADRSGLVAARYRPARRLLLVSARHRGHRSLQRRIPDRQRLAQHFRPLRGAPQRRFGILDEFRPRETGRTASEPRRGESRLEHLRQLRFVQQFRLVDRQRGRPSRRNQCRRIRRQTGQRPGQPFHRLPRLEQLRRCVGPLRMRSRRGDDRLLGMAHGAS